MQTLLDPVEGTFLDFLCFRRPWFLNFPFKQDQTLSVAFNAGLSAVMSKVFRLNN